MIKATLIALTLITLLGATYYFISKDRPIASINPAKQNEIWSKGWWEARHQEKLKLAKTSDIDLLTLGDSITQGWEDQGSSVWHTYYQHRKAFNLGFNGDKTENVLWRLQNGAVDNMQPKLVVLMIGTNNTGHRMDSAEHTALGVEAILKELRKRLPRAKILLLGILPRSASPENKMRKRNQAINNIITGFEDGEFIYYLNINHVFLDNNGELHEDVMPDLLHPNKLGYERWADAMEMKVNQLLN